MDFENSLELFDFEKIELLVIFSQKFARDIIAKQIHFIGNFFKRKTLSWKLLKIREHMQEQG